eukprot:TRINITY_DN34581_c0_g2_i1.p1 TRINITY_DN34581_c0_g2~~TRINITY_DN34581_c0_g2_i1.p1  ORF type:complete len:524 (-),score=107.11 TRINITY_DN34581_c0_g2_i1:148-1581(-)
MASVDILSDDDEPMPTGSAGLAPPSAEPALPAPVQASLTPGVGVAAAADVELLSDDDDEPVAPPASAPTNVAPPITLVAATSLPTAEMSSVSTVAVALPTSGGGEGGNVDVLSDSDDDAPIGAVVAPATAAGLVAQEPNTAAPAPAETSDAMSAAVAESQRPGLRSVVVAHMELEDSDDSDDECIKPDIQTSVSQTTPACQTPAPKRSVCTGEGDASPSEPAAKTAKKSNPTAKAKDADVDGTKKACAKGVPSKPERKLTKEEMEQRVLSYMQLQNRPYNAQNVFDNLHGAVPKTQVQALLEALAANGQLKEKEYGKSKTYLAAQVAAAPEAIGEEAKILEAEIASTEVSLREIKEQLDVTKRSAGAFRTHKALVDNAESAAQEVVTLEGRLASLREVAASNDAAGENVDVDINEVHGAEEAFRNAVGEWRRRKRLCMNVLSLFSERSDVKVEKMIDKYGIDTDEDCDQHMPQLAQT